MILEQSDAPLQIDGVDDAAVLDGRLGVHPDHVFTDGQTGSRERGPDGQPFPVVLRDVG